MISGDTKKSDSDGNQSPTPSVDKQSSQQPASLTHKLSISSSTSSPKNGPTAASQQQNSITTANNAAAMSYPYHISPSTIPGTLHFNNYGAIDWSVSGLVAYGCQNRIVIVDTNRSMTYCQTLHRHKHVVCHVKWSPMVATSQLASVDISGVIIVWNVLDSTPLTVILATNETKVVNFFHWICLDRHLDGSSNTHSLLGLFNDTGDEATGSKAQSPTTFKSSNLPKTSFLLAFYQQTNSFVLYDADLGEAVVRWAVDHKVSHVAYNPFFTFNRSCDSSVHNLLVGFKAASGSDEKLYFGLARLNESDFLSTTGSSGDESSSKEPRKLPLSFVTYSMQSSSGDIGGGSASGGSAKSPSSNRSLRYDLITRLEPPKVPSALAPATDSATSSTTSLESYIQLEYHKSVRNQIFIVFPRDIYLIDLSIETIINVIPLERNCSKLVKISSCAGRNSFYAFHETGNVSFRLYQKKVIHDRSTLELPGQPPVAAAPEKSVVDHGAGGEDLAAGADTNQASFLNVGYINLCQSESIRLTKQNKIFGYSMAPFDETRVAFLLSSGRLVVKSLICQKVVQSESSSSNSDNSMGYIVNQTVPVPCLSDLIKPQEYQLGAFLLPSDSSGQLKSFDSISYKILVTNFISGLNSLPTVVRMCPPLTLQNIKKHRPLLAVGDSLGLLQIWLLNGNSSTLHREFSVHSYPVAGIEWTGLNSLISFSYPTINSPSHSNHHSSFVALSTFTGSGSSSGRVTNELVHIDIETGKVTPFRTNRIQDSSPIETIRVSHLKQYLIILFKHDDPFEIWDVRSLTLLKVMSKSMSNISAVEWSPLYNKKQVSRSSEMSDSDTSQPSSSASVGSSYVPIKENFIVTNRNLFHFSIEGNLVREMSCIPPDADSGHVNVTSIAWKSDQVLLGDASGTLNLWHLKRKISATEPTFRGFIRKIRFGPGRGNMKCLILYADFGVDIWDIAEFRVCAQLKYPRDMSFKIIDVDWASCDLPVLCTAEGFIFVTDTKLKTYSSSIALRDVDRDQVARLFAIKDQLEIESMFSLSIDSSYSFLSAQSKKDILRRSMFCIPYKSSIEENTTSDPELTPEKSTTATQQPQIDIRQFIQWQILLAKLLPNASDFDFWAILDSILYGGEELDSRLDLFLDAKHYRTLQQEKLLLLEAARKTYSHACLAYQMNLRLKNFQRAVQILLETESFQHGGGGGGGDFYVDALKACLIASLQSDLTGNKSPVGATNRASMAKSPTQDSVVDNVDLSDDISVGGGGFDENSGGSSSKAASPGGGNKDVVAPVIKLVATSLIASGRILEGVELLSFISKTADSCRYLQSADKWLDSIWLAKSSLDPNECTEVIRRWCELLIGSKFHSDQQTAIKMYLSRRQFSRVLRALNRLSDLKAFPFALVCAAAQLIDINDYKELLEEIFDGFVGRFFGYDDKKLAALKAGETMVMIGDGGDLGQEVEEESDLLVPNQEETLRQCWALFSGQFVAN